MLLKGPSPLQPFVTWDSMQKSKQTTAEPVPTPWIPQHTHGKVSWLFYRGEMRNWNTGSELDLGAALPFLRALLIPRDAAEPVVCPGLPEGDVLLLGHPCTQIPGEQVPSSHLHTPGGMHLTCRHSLQWIPDPSSLSLCSLERMLDKKEQYKPRKPHHGVTPALPFCLQRKRIAGNISSLEMTGWLEYSDKELSSAEPLLQTSQARNKTKVLLL